MSTDLLAAAGQAGSGRRGETGRMNVRGITLREYFRLCEEE
jgi:hypothetical protein